jgi:hypothetical protein
MSSIKIAILKLSYRNLNILTTKIFTTTIVPQSQELFMSLRYDPCVSLRVMTVGCPETCRSVAPDRRGVAVRRLHTPSQYIDSVIITVGTSRVDKALECHEPHILSNEGDTS